MPEDKKISINNVIMFGGSIIAFLIGSGFATGQEVLQYFTAYGFWGMAGTLVMFIVFLYVCSSFILVGYDNTFEKPNDVYILLWKIHRNFFRLFFNFVYIYVVFCYDSWSGSDYETAIWNFRSYRSYCYGYIIWSNGCFRT